MPPTSAASESAGSGEPEVHGLQGVTLFEREEEAAAAPSSRAGVAPAPAAAAPDDQQGAAAPKRKFVPRERAVPSSSLGRVLGFGQLGASLLYGTMRESVSRALGASKPAAGCVARRGAVPWLGLLLLLGLRWLHGAWCTHAGPPAVKASGPCCVAPAPACRLPKPGRCAVLPTPPQPRLPCLPAAPQPLRLADD